jgi:LmbE family N-acetylglucosaminyl deacetylase
MAISGGRLKNKRVRILVGIFSAAAAVAPAAIPLSSQSLPSAVEAIDKARVGTRILFTTAHPDDEWSSLLAYLSRGLDADVGLLSITRGQGGQNAIGPEQGGELGVIRTEELLAAGKHYGVHQFFTRAPDFGFSKSADETLKIWGDVPLEDMVRLIRTFRPEVVINGWGGVRSGHGQHQASGILTPQAVAAAADPNAFPAQIAQGLSPWKVTLELRGARNGDSGAVQLPVNDISPLWGESYVDMGMEGHAQHRSQGTPSFFGNPFFRRPIYLSRENEKGEETGAFESKLLAEPVSAIAARFPDLQSMMQRTLASVEQKLADASKSARELDRAAAGKSLAEAGQQIENLRNEVAKHSGASTAGALWELDYEHQAIDNALAEVVALYTDVSADRHELVAGETFGVTLNLPDKPAVAATWAADNTSLELPQGWTAKLGEAKEGSRTYHFDVSIPAGQKPPSSPEDAILPFPAPLVKLALRVNVDGYEFKIRKPVDSMAATTTGILTYPLELVPAVTLTAEQPQIMVPLRQASEPKTLLARVRYHGANPAKVSVGIDVPSGWSAQMVAPLDFASAGDQLIRFSVKPPASVAPGAYALHPFAKLGDEMFRTSLEPIPTLPTRDWSDPDDATVHVLNLAVPAGLHIGYIAAENDPLPEVLRQLGVRVDLLDEVALAFGDLSRYDAIAVGIRAYELRPDLMRSNQRLLDYVSRGGTLLVQYQRDFAWNKLLPAPFPAKMPEQTSRVTDAKSPVRFLAPQNPLLNVPNKIALADFEGWVQERGLYFWGTFDSKYQPVLGLQDPGEPEAKGALVYAHDGKGIYIYTGLSFFRELPAGVPGAYRLFVNLLSQTQRTGAHD